MFTLKRNPARKTPSLADQLARFRTSALFQADIEAHALSCDMSSEGQAALFNEAKQRYESVAGEPWSKKVAHPRKLSRDLQAWYITYRPDLIENGGKVAVEQHEWVGLR